MKRLNLIIGKKQIVIASLAVLLGAAAAVNFIIAGNKKQTSAKQVGADYGDAAYVSASANENDGEADETAAYFAKARLEKQQTRDEAAEVLASMYTGGDAVGDEKDVMEENAKELSGRMESENAVESVIRAQGFEDALCYLSDDGANIIVKTDGLDEAGAAKIKSALLSEVEVAADKITIVEVH